MISVLKKKLNKKKGFTLAELLVVVAIIAVMVAIAIPTFKAATDKAYEGVAEANARSAYAEWMIQYISTDEAPAKNSTITYNTGGKKTVCTLDDINVENGDVTMKVSAQVDGMSEAEEFEFSSKSTAAAGS